MSTFASHPPLNIFETVRDRGLVQNGHWGIKWSRNRCRHVIPNGQTRDVTPISL